MAKKEREKKKIYIYIYIWSSKYMKKSAKYAWGLWFDFRWGLRLWIFFFTWLNSFISIYMGGIIHSENYNTYSISHNFIKKMFQTYKLNELHSKQLYTHLFDSTVNMLLHLLYLIFAHPEWINRQMYTKRPSCHENTAFRVGLNFRKGNQYYLRFTSQEMMVNLKFSLCREAWKPEFSKQGKE